MKGELRALGLAHGLLLGLLLALPLVASPMLLPWAAEALFIMGGFQLRLADRRWDMRGGPLGWISHIRMAPGRLLPWGAAAVVALIARRTQDAQAIIGAALLCELLLYPMCAHLIGRLARPLAAALLLLLIAGQAAAGSEMMRYMLAFITGMTACLVWLRGPDGDARATGLAFAGLSAAVAAPMAAPQLLPFAVPAGSVCAVLALANLSVLRRRPVPWCSNGGQDRLKRGLWPIPSWLS
jgi:hypothetical protein